MFGLQEFSIDFLTDSLWMLIPTFLILVGLSVYLYLKTNPPLPLYLKIILTTFRIITVLAIILSLAQPVISYTREFERLPRAALLLDESLSMEKSELGKSRKARMDSLLSSVEFENLQKNLDISTYYFASGLTEDISTLDKSRTSLGDIIKQLNTKEIGNNSDYWLLLSDGNSNSGSEPAAASNGLSTPVITVDMALSGGNSDIGLGDIEFNPVMFAGQSGEIKISAYWQNIENQKIKVRLLDSNRVKSEYSLNINQNEGLSDITLKYIPETPGQKILQIEISPVPGEENQENNKRSMSIKVLKSRLSVLLVCERPDYEIGFLKRFYERTEKYEIELKVLGEKSGNLFSRFPNTQASLNRFDLIILYDMNLNSLEPHKDIINSYLADKGGALWVLLGENFSKTTQINNWMKQILPFYPSGNQKIEYLSFHGEPSESNLFHPAVRLGNSQSEIRQIWAELPPFKSLLACENIASDAEILLYATASGVGRNNLPIMGYKRLGAGKIFAAASLPLWNWGFINIGFGETDSYYSEYIENLSSWLTVADDLEPVRITPGKNIYNRGEIIIFKGFAYDMGYRPIPDVNGTIKLEKINSKEITETDLISQREGRYEADFYNIEPGEYKYFGQFSKDGRILKEVEGKILVESFSLEEFDLSGNPEILRAISKNSGGAYHRAAEFEDALLAIDTKPRLVKDNNEFKLFNKFWLLLIIIGVLVTEWLVRKLNQLI